MRMTVGIIKSKGKQSYIESILKNRREIPLMNSYKRKRYVNMTKKKMN